MISKRATGLLMAALLVAAATASAQDAMDKLKDTTPAERATVQTMMMKQKLGLTPEQLPSVKEINLEAATQMQPILTGSQGKLMKMRRAKEIESQRDSQLQGVVTPPQYQQWLAEKEAMRQKVEQKLMEKHKGGAS